MGAGHRRAGISRYIYSDKAAAAVVIRLDMIPKAAFGGLHVAFFGRTFPQCSKGVSSGQLELDVHSVGEGAQTT